MSPAGPARSSFFAVAAPGLEPLVAAELAMLGVRGTVEAGGVAWEGDAGSMGAANLHLRCASRVLLRVASFEARSFSELERRARAIPWAHWLHRERAVRLRVSSHRSKLYHERAIAERVQAAIDRATGAPPQRSGADPDDDGGDDVQLFIVRVERDRFVISADTSGAHLHVRGYRQAVAKAPLRESLASALIDVSGWPDDAPLFDPLCGSGTIAIEAALRARGIAPGLATVDRSPRDFAFLHWPEPARMDWPALVESARAQIRPAAAAPIWGSDRDAGAVEAAIANAARAGVSDDVIFSRHALTSAPAPDGPGWLVSNPPYGVRVGRTGPLRDLYAALGNRARRELPGWTVALLVANLRLAAETRLGLQARLHTRTGGLAVHAMVGRVPA